MAVWFNAWCIAFRCLRHDAPYGMNPTLNSHPILTRASVLGTHTRRTNSSQSDHRDLRSIRVVLGSLVKQVLGNLFRVDDENLLTEDLEVQEIT